MMEYWKFDGMKFEEENYIQYYEFENEYVRRQINVNFFRKGISYLEIQKREDWAEMFDQPLTDFYRVSMERLTADEFEVLWRNKP
ncbi:hypothetical protein [Chitinophaga nivalis]|uniref:Phage protein n=1 Tax=Chitinophaga nivalis TaxID=2991709 RepID=A0ABT3IHY2_9BACT|nr:hypothetical protein [Chitinophaga nivalis]MCW3466755.1 hypothetical protein [Chitinophaga nivalis]MCW3483554.1 hypothetical protein [Chitinophaga nivalis]